MFEQFRQENAVRRALHAIARQRVSLILQPGNVIVIENSAPDDEWFDIAVRTSHIRGWVEILHHAVPTGKLSFTGETPVFPDVVSPKPMYRLTEGGWAVINRSHGWVLATFVVSAISLIATVFSILITK